jgi:hypothetical protein
MSKQADDLRATIRIGDEKDVVDLVKTPYMASFVQVQRLINQTQPSLCTQRFLSSSWP